MKKAKLYFFVIILVFITAIVFAQNPSPIGTWEGQDDLNRRVVLEIGQRNWNMWISGSFFGSGTYRIGDSFTHLILSSGREYGAFFVLFHGNGISVQRADSSRAFILNKQNSSSNQPNTTDNRPLITIVNRTGYTIRSLFIISSASTSNSFGSNVLSSQLTNGQSRGVRLSQPLNVVNRYDIRIVDTDGDTYTKWNVLVSNNATITFTFDDID